MEFRVVIPGLIPALLTGVIIAIIGKLSSIPFSAIQVAIVVVVVIVASFLVQLFFRSTAWK